MVFCVAADCKWGFANSSSIALNDTKSATLTKSNVLLDSMTLAKSIFELLELLRALTFGSDGTLKCRAIQTTARIELRWCSGLCSKVMLE